MKEVAIKQLGSDKEPLFLELRPGMTAMDLLVAANLTDCVLARKNTSGFLAPQEVLYDLLTDGEMLWAYSPECELY